MIRELAIAKVRYVRGSSYFQSVVFGIGIITANIKLFSETITFYGFDPMYFYCIAPPAYLMLCYYIGYIDERFGLWKCENEYNWKNVNPTSNKLVNDVEEIKNMLKK